MSQVEQTAEAPPAGLRSGRIRRVIVVGEESEKLHHDLAETGFEIVDEHGNPELLISYGGDGTLLGSDRVFPNLPKVPIRRNGEIVKCPRHVNREVFARIARNDYLLTRLPRLYARVKSHEFHAINDVVFRNENATSAVRYRVRIDGTPYSDEIVGDGLVVATPFGSSAYYRSITNSVFRVGMGLAFNNSTEGVNHLVLNPKSTIEVEVTRGPAIVLGDNLTNPIQIDRGELLTIKMSSQFAELWELSSLTCRDCVMKDTGRPVGYRHV